MEDLGFTTMPEQAIADVELKIVLLTSSHCLNDIDMQISFNLHLEHTAADDPCSADSTDGQVRIRLVLAHTIPDKAHAQHVTSLI